MEEDRKVWVDFERKLYTFLWKVLIPDTQVKLQQFTGKGSVGESLLITSFLCEFDRPSKCFQAE